MASSGGVFGDQSAEAGADLSDKFYRFVKRAAGDKVVLCGAGERSCGILQNKPKAGDPAAVRSVAGSTSKLEVDGTQGGGIAVGSKLKSDGNGKGIVAAGADDEVCAIANAACTADGIVIEVEIANRQV